jgi:hypothetical protein
VVSFEFLSQTGFTHNSKLTTQNAAHGRRQENKLLVTTAKQRGQLLYDRCEQWVVNIANFFAIFCR